METCKLQVIILIPISIFAQAPVTDKVLMTTGEVKQGQVVGVDDQAIIFWCIRMMQSNIS